MCKIAIGKTKEVKKGIGSECRLQVLSKNVKLLQNLCKKKKGRIPAWGAGEEFYNWGSTFRAVEL